MRNTIICALSIVGILPDSSAPERIFIMPTTSNKSEAEPAPAKPEDAKPLGVASASAPDTLATPQVKPIIHRLAALDKDTETGSSLLSR